MSLKRHACRFAPHPSSDHLWISDDILNHALHRFTLLRAPRRYGSNVPGPLEARKRAAKRRMMGLAPVAGGPHIHPGLLIGGRRAQEGPQNWQWQSPGVLSPPGGSQWALQNNEGNSALELGTSDVWGQLPLPSWMMDYDRKKDEKVLPEEVENAGDANESQKPMYSSPEARLQDTNDLDVMRNIIGSFDEQNSLREKHSRIALRQLLKADLNMDKILDFLADPILNPRSARSLDCLTNHFRRNSNHQEIKRLCQWVGRQYHVGSCSDQDLLRLMKQLFQRRHRTQWQDSLDELCRDVVQAVQASPVVNVNDLSSDTYCFLLKVVFRNLYSESMFTAGMELLKELNITSDRQLSNPIRRLGQVIERMLCSWDPSRITELEVEELNPKLPMLLLMLPPNRLISTIQLISMRIIDFSSSEDDLIWQKHSIWWSALRSPNVFSRIKNTKCLRDIESALRRRREDVIDSEAMIKIHEKLDRNDTNAGRWRFLDRQEIPLERCPELAEALILDSTRNWDTAIDLRELRQPKALVELQEAGNGARAEQLQFDRVRLLERMALAYAEAPHLHPSIAFQYTYRCWALHRRDDLGPFRAPMIRALTNSGLVRPLQVGQTMSYSRLKFILQQVEEVEGKDAMKRLGHTVLQWREDVNRQSQKNLEEKRENIRAEREMAIRDLVEEDLERWERSTNMGVAGAATSSKETLSQELTLSNVISPSGNSTLIDRNGLSSRFGQPSTSPESEQDLIHARFPEGSPVIHEPSASTIRLPQGTHRGGASLPVDSSPFPLEAYDEYTLSPNDNSSDGGTSAISHPFTPLDSNTSHTPDHREDSNPQPTTPQIDRDYHTHVSTDIQLSGQALQQHSTPIPNTSPPSPAVETPASLYRTIISYKTTHTRSEAPAQSPKTRSIDTLLGKLNSTHEFPLELHPIPQCSLASAAIIHNHATSKGNVDNNKRWRNIAADTDREAKPAPKHDVEENAGPMFLGMGNWVQPSLGKLQRLGMFRLVRKGAARGTRRLRLKVKGPPEKRLV
ncbi:MAG: hypothetical protein Q9218_001328 [Villophora microphyllina]